MTTNNKTHATPDTSAILSTLRIGKVRQRTSCGGTWVVGTLAGHQFDALVFREHAESEAFELGTSRISKLWLRHRETRQTAANFDRGWDVRPSTPLAAAIVDALAARLAQVIYPE